MALYRNKFGLKHILLYSVAIILALALLVWVLQKIFPPKAQDVKIVSTPRITEMKVRQSYQYDEDGRAQAEGGGGFIWSCEGSPSGMTIDENGRIAWTPGKSGLFELKVQVANDSDKFDRQEWQVKVIGPPVIKDPGVLKCVPNKTFRYKLEDLSYPKCDSFKIVSVSPPKGLTLDVKTGEFSWTPTETGDHTVTVRATNDAGTAELDVMFRVAVEIKHKAKPLEKARQVVKEVKKRREERYEQAEKQKEKAEKREKEVKDNPKKDVAEVVAASVTDKKVAEKMVSSAKKDLEDLKNVEKKITEQIPREKNEKELFETVEKQVQEEKKHTEKEIKIREDESDLFRKNLERIAEQKKKQVEEKVQAEVKRREAREKKAAEIREKLQARKDEHKKAPEKRLTEITAEQLADYHKIKKMEADAGKQIVDGKLKNEADQLEAIIKVDPDGVPRAIRDAIDQVKKEKEKEKKQQEKIANEKISAYADYEKYREAMKEKDLKKEGTKPARESMLNGKKLLHDGCKSRLLES